MTAEAVCAGSVHRGCAPVAVPKPLAGASAAVERAFDATEAMHQFPPLIAEADANLAGPTALLDIRHGLKQHRFVEFDCP